MILLFGPDVRRADGLSLSRRPEEAFGFVFAVGRCVS